MPDEVKVELTKPGNDNLIPYQRANGAPFVVRPNDHAVQAVEHLLPSPHRRRGHTAIGDVASLIAACKARDPSGVAPIYWTRDGDIDIVLNDDGWRDERLGFALVPTPEWKQWAALDGFWHGHGSILEAFEDRQQDFQDPSPAKMLELLRAVKITTNGRVVSAKSIDTGSITLEYEATNSVAQGTTFPADFKLGLRLFEGTPPYELVCRLRYRTIDSKLQLSVRIVNRQPVEEAVVKDMMTAIATGLPNNPRYRVRELPRSVAAF
jgi:uncharacterized protein YfdQ (DUF2303 family)